MAGSPAPLLRERGAGGRPGRCGAPGGGPRQSASEREKLRMRQLARALRTLRLYLPPALAPAGQSLTKVETLRLAARYIGHLSALLGLSEEALARRRGAAARRCPLCPPGLGCCRPPPPPASPPGAWGSPPYGPAAGAPPELDGAPGVGTSTWGSLPYGPMAGSPPELDGALIIDASSWLPPPHCAGAGSPPELDGAPGVGTSTWGLLHCSPVAGTPLELDGAPSMGTGTWGSLPCGPAAGTPPELLGTPGSDSGSWSSSLRGLGAATPLDPSRRRDAVTGTGTVSSSCAEPAAPRAAVMDTGPRGLPTHGSQLDARYQLGSPQALDPLVTPGTQGAAGPPGCAPARCWGWWS